MTYEARAGDRGREVEIAGDGPEFTVTLDGAARRARLVPAIPPDHFVLLLDGAPVPVVLRRDGDTVVCEIGSEQHRVEVARKLPIAAKTSAAAAGSRIAVAAPMPGLLISIEVAPGDHVDEDQPVAILEAMKMQMELRAPRAGRVEQVHAQPGREVLAGQALVSLSHE